MFKEYDLDITSYSNQKFVSYLNLTLNLKDCTIRPYRKPDEQMLPRDIIKHIPASIETFLSKLTSNEMLFKESAIHYPDNMLQSGYNKKLLYNFTETNHQKHSEYERKIIWFNPLFSKNVSAKIGNFF